MEGRGKIPSCSIQVQWKPLDEDCRSGSIVLQRLGKYKLQGPLYELEALPSPTSHSRPPIVTDKTPPLPFRKTRAILKDMFLDPLSDQPMSATFVIQPTDEFARVRLPIRYLNEEKCPGLKVGFLNEFVTGVDVRVPPNVKPPMRAYLDLEGLCVRKKRFVRDLKFDGMDQGCEVTLHADTPLAIITKS